MSDNAGIIEPKTNMTFAKLVPKIPTYRIVNYINTFLFDTNQNNLECLSLASIFSLESASKTRS
jgi:hypothetical protein